MCSISGCRLKALTGTATVLSMFKVITYVSVTSLWGDKGMKIEAVSKNVLCKKRIMFFTSSQTSHFHIPFTNLYLFSDYYQTPSPLTFDTHLAYLFSRECFYHLFSPI